MTDFTIPPIAPVAFNGVLAFAWIAVFLVLGMVLRAVFPLFKRYLIPACIVGGSLGFILQSLGLVDATGFILDKSIMQNIVYHLFNLTWVFIGLKVPKQSTNLGTSTKTVIGYFSIMNIANCFAYGLAIATTIILATIGLNSGPETMGSLVANGFLTGPGQALTVANIWAAATSYTGLPDFALAGGAIGFAIAIIVGVFLINIVARKKKIELITCPTEEEGCGFYNECTDTEEAGKQTTSATSIDVLAWHFGIGLLTYFLSYAIAVFLFIILPPALKVFVWSTFFVFGVAVAICVRQFLIKINKAHLLCNDINNRVSNTLVDFMICGTFICIEIGNVAQYMLPFIATVVVCTTSIGAVLWVYCGRLKENSLELFAYLFGNLTGTVSTGLILLRLVDPNGKSNVPVRMAIASTLGISTTIIYPALMHLEPLYHMQSWYAVGGFAAIGVFLFFVIKFINLPHTDKLWEN